MSSDMPKSVRLESSIGVCPSCQQTVEHPQSQQVKHIGDLTVSFGPCQSCQAPLVVMTIQGSAQTTAIGLMTDCGQAEINQFWGQAPISENDCIALHQWLEQPLRVTHLVS